MAIAEIATRRTVEVRAVGAGPEPMPWTLLDLVRAVGEVTDDEAEIVATVLHMLRSGRVRLCGSFRGHPIDDFTH